jgi:hypothetical protein
VGACHYVFMTRASRVTSVAGARADSVRLMGEIVRQRLEVAVTPVFQKAAAQVGPARGSRRTAGRPLIPGGAREEGVEMSLEGAVEDRALWLAAMIGRQGTESGHARAGATTGWPVEPKTWLQAGSNTPRATVILRGHG